MTAIHAASGYIAVSPVTTDKLRILQVGGVELNLDGFQARVNGSIIQLPPKEFTLLAVLMSHAGKALTRRELLDRTWGDGYPDTNKTLNVHVMRVRNRMRKAGAADCANAIRTVRGSGYIFDLSAWPDHPVRIADDDPVGTLSSPPTQPASGTSDRS